MLAQTCLSYRNTGSTYFVDRHTDRQTDRQTDGGDWRKDREIDELTDGVQNYSSIRCKKCSGTNMVKGSNYVVSMMHCFYSQTIITFICDFEIIC